MRLEQENDDLAHEMVESKLSLKSELDQVYIIYMSMSLIHDTCSGASIIRISESVLVEELGLVP